MAYTGRDKVAFVSGGFPSEPTKFMCWEVLGRERLSRPFRFDVKITCKGGGSLTPAELAKLRESPCAIVLGTDGENEDDSTATEQTVYGVVKRVKSHPVSEGYSSYRVRVVPTVSLLGLGRLSRVFQRTGGGTNTRITDVAEVLFKQHGYEEYRFVPTKLTSRAREFMVQYDESDWKLLQRWLEYEGLFYYFEHVDQEDDASGKPVDKAVDRLIITDRNPSKGTAAPTLTYTDQNLSNVSGQLSITDWQIHDRRVPQRAAVVDYNYRQANKERGAKVAAPQGEAFATTDDTSHRQDLYGTAYEFRSQQLPPTKTVNKGKDNEKKVFDPNADDMAERRAERLACRSRTYVGQTACVSLRPGSVFTLAGAVNCSPDDDNTDYLVTGVDVELTQDTPKAEDRLSYRATIQAIRLGDPFRPERRTRWPRIDGVVNAHLCPLGEEATTTPPMDDWGRYELQLPYDLGGRYDDEHDIQKDDDAPMRARIYVRLAQPSAGAGYGTHFPSRPGTEVLVAHVAGDPDCPVIVGAVYNDQSPSPVTTENETQSVMKTYSEITIEAEDLQGSGSE